MTGSSDPRKTLNGKDRYAIDLVSVSKLFARRAAVRGAYSTLKSLFVQCLSGTLLVGSRAGKRSTACDAQNQGRTNFALKDLTLRIPRGAAVGIIGRNGSGKSTLLKLISGIYRPSAGTISVNGTIAALIELGAGFHPDFTGRENVYLAGVMHGLSRKQIDDRFEQIVDFAELKEVIDEPVRTYSSGMFMRLGFSLAVHTNPDILIVDEVLAVGDASFVVKCQERLAQLRRSGKTLLLVTHDLEAVLRWCDEVVWLDKGEVQDRGEPRRVIDAYRQFVEKGEEEFLKAQNEAFEQDALERDATEGDGAQVGAEAPSGLDADLAPERWGSREVEISHVVLSSKQGEEAAVFHSADSMCIELYVNVNEPVKSLVCGVGITRTDGVAVAGTNTTLDKFVLPHLETGSVIRFEIERLGLNEGTYTVDVALHGEDGYPYDYHLRHCRFAVRSGVGRLGLVDLNARWSCLLPAQACKSA